MQNKSLLERTLAKMEKSQQKKKEVVEYMQLHKPHLLWSVFKTNRIKDCCNVLMFRDYLNWEQKLYKANFCKYDKFCLACSTRRSIRMIQRFEQWIQQYQLYNKHRYHITLTVKHNRNQSLKTVLNKLCSAKEKLWKRYRNWKRTSQKTKSFMNYFDWIISSIEVTYNERNWWHPHIHILACSDYELPIVVEYPWWKETHLNKELQKEWYDVTWDSYQISMRKIRVDQWYFDRNWIWEVFKYAVKFSTLDVPHLVDLIELQHNRKYHFFSTYGIFRWWKLDSEDKWDDKDFIERTLTYFEDEYKEDNDDLEIKTPNDKNSNPNKTPKGLVTVQEAFDEIFN